MEVRCVRLGGRGGWGGKVCEGWFVAVTGPTLAIHGGLRLGFDPKHLVAPFFLSFFQSLCHCLWAPFPCRQYPVLKVMCVCSQLMSATLIINQ